MKAKVIFLSAGLCACASSKGDDVPATMYPDSSQRPLERPATASLWNQAPESLFGNRRARQAGDILTVIVEIDDTAELGNTVEQSRTNSENFELRALFGAPEWATNVLPGGATTQPGADLSRNSSFSGEGTIRREDRIEVRLAARVIEERPNGDLVIHGEQSVRVNHEERILRAEGIVRPEDISRNNTISHDRIANAQIEYVGNGVSSRTVQPRLGNRLLDLIIPF